jgi:hypothetical protein
MLNRGKSMNFETDVHDDHLRGFITEQNFAEAEEEFPGITTYYEHCRRKPGTFLDLVWQFERTLVARRDLLLGRRPVAAEIASAPRRDEALAVG